MKFDRSALEANLYRTLAAVENLRLQATEQAVIYHAMVARAAHGEEIFEMEWRDIEMSLESIARRVARLQLVFQFQQRELDCAAPAADQQLTDIAEALAFSTPVAGNA